MIARSKNKRGKPRVTKTRLSIRIWLVERMAFLDLTNMAALALDQTIKHSLARKYACHEGVLGVGVGESNIKTASWVDQMRQNLCRKWIELWVMVVRKAWSSSVVCNINWRFMNLNDSPFQANITSKSASLELVIVVLLTACKTQEAFFNCDW